MDDITVVNKSWQGKNLRANVLFSRAGVAQHIWINSGHGAVLIDTGDGLLRDVLAAKLDLAQVRAIFYTHGHFDHMAGLHALLGFLRMVGRIEPLPIYAPAGCTEVKSMLDSFIDCYRGSIGFDLSYHELQPMAATEVEDMTVTAHRSRRHDRHRLSDDSLREYCRLRRSRSDSGYGLSGCRQRRVGRCQRRQWEMPVT
jgi:ribonuclease BN (tRNA processing enzyme)